MKKTLLCLAAVLMSFTAANAQKVISIEGASGLLSKKSTELVPPTMRMAPSVPNRIALEQGERIMGYYTSDELDLSKYSSIGATGAPGTLQAGVEFTPEIIGNFVGGQITKARFGIYESVGASTVYVYSVTQEGFISEPLAEASLETTAQGWNEVTFSTPVTIEAGLDYLIAYEYKQTQNNYPLLVDYMFNNYAYDGGFLLYGNLGSGLGWYNMGTTYGNLCIQAVVKGGNFVDDDVTLKNITLGSQYCQAGDVLKYSVGISNNGNNVPTSYKLNVSIDGEVVSTIDSPFALSYNVEPYDGSVTLPAGIESGAHTLSVSVAEINGEVPTENVSDDEASATFYVLSESLPRQKNLVEEFTSTTCPYCPLGHEVLDKLKAARTDLAVAVLHNNYPGESTLGTSETDSLSQVLCSGYSNPSAAFNRYYVSDPSVNTYGTLNLVTSYDAPYHDMVVEMFSEIIDMSSENPSLAGVDIDVDYDETTKLANITVSGNAVEGFNELMDNATLTVYLTEDSIVEPQNNYGMMDYEYVHNNIVRDVVSDKFGDQLSWTGETSYSNTYSVSVEDGWNVANMHVVAFISKGILNPNDPNNLFANYPNNLWVTNANVVPVVFDATGITNVNTSASDVKEVARYTLDGSKISAPVKGVNIVKMSDGTTHKVVVK